MKSGIVSSQIVRCAVLDIFKPTGIDLNLRNHFGFDAPFIFLQTLTRARAINKVNRNLTLGALVGFGAGNLIMRRYLTGFHYSRKGGFNPLER